MREKPRTSCPVSDFALTSGSALRRRIFLPSNLSRQYFNTLRSERTTRLIDLQHDGLMQTKRRLPSLFLCSSERSLPLYEVPGKNVEDCLSIVQFVAAMPNRLIIRPFSNHSLPCSFPQDPLLLADVPGMRVSLVPTVIA